MCVVVDIGFLSLLRPISDFAMLGETISDFAILLLPISTRTNLNVTKHHQKIQNRGRRERRPSGRSEQPPFLDFHVGPGVASA